ncbi:MAG: hypothetical protein EA001_00595 [Oscillatoriales cyanobacterium]|nr:MAG: hypothetical protein EA001_00595 [Oscillatoriales cyanobacterium]
MPRCYTIGAIASLVAVSAIGLPAIAAPADRFQTPSGNIHCLVFSAENGQNRLRCDVLENQAQIPPQPADCPLDWGNVFTMGDRQPGKFGCAADTVFDPSHPVLRYGQTWSFGGFRCDATTSRLRCRNRTGDFWELSREHQRFY